MHREVLKVMMPAEAVGDRLPRILAHGAATHHMGAAQPDLEAAQLQLLDHRAGFSQAAGWVGIVMYGYDAAGAGGELDLGHAHEAAAYAIPGVIRHPVIQHR